MSVPRLQEAMEVVASEFDAFVLIGRADDLPQTYEFIIRGDDEKLRLAALRWGCDGSPSQPLSAEVEETVAFAREILQTLQDKRRGGDAIEGIACDFAEAVVQLADACVVGLPCEKHGGMVHGREAEELRAGVEQILHNTAEVHPEDEESVLASVRKALIFLLDRIDARDSLTFREVTDPKASEAPCT